MTSSLTPLLKPIRERLERATPGPWESNGVYVRQPLFNKGYPKGEIRWIQSLTMEHEDRQQPDAEFIAHAPETIAKLLKCVERMEQLVCVGEEGLDCMVCRMKKDVRAILEEGK